MATPGFAGKILLVNLTNKEIKALDTEKYEAYGGGHGTSTALFWEYCVAPGDWDLHDAFDPRNMVSLMTGAVSGTGVRMERESWRWIVRGADGISGITACRLLTWKKAISP